MKWKLWAYDIDGTFFHIGEKWWVELHGLEHPIVEVLIESSKDGAYYGWLEHGENIPSMIWSDELRFNMCFPYGYEAEEKKEEGKMIRLNITIIEQ